MARKKESLPLRINNLRGLVAALELGAQAAQVCEQTKVAPNSPGAWLQTARLIQHHAETLKDALAEAKHSL